MCFRIVIAIGILVATAAGFLDAARADGKRFRLVAPGDLVDSGLVRFMVPRFALKTGVRVELVDPGTDADADFNADGRGRRAFDGLGKRWSIDVRGGPSAAAAERFADWLLGDIGQRTVTSFQVDGQQIFTSAAQTAQATKVAVIDGDFERGEQLAVRHCGRCHTVNDRTRMGSIGSTPSFALMRSFRDWSARFEAFFTLNPHPAFTQVEGVSEPFDPMRPPPIAPIEITLDEIGSILAFVSRIEPADLGAPLQLQ